MARILISCPAGRGDVPTGYRTGDLDLGAGPFSRSFRCTCGDIHTWDETQAWAEEISQAATIRSYEIEAGTDVGASPS
ncbi:hypothetical protein [Phenylobacterium sp.]|jgi:hypothetical protein|uniref:hypothetical protein n=1 Tax=Phenylobacterium sp. TaxID=1871053 RepID=UPI002F92DBB3